MPQPKTVTRMIKNAKVVAKVLFLLILFNILVISCAAGIVMPLFERITGWLFDQGVSVDVLLYGFPFFCLVAIALLLLAMMWLSRSGTKDLLDPDLVQFVPNGEEDSPPPGWREWAEKKGFEPAGLFRQTSTVLAIAAWRAPDHPTFFYCCFRGEQPRFEFVTLFKDGVVLATGNSKIVRSTGGPRALYAQTYARSSPQDLWPLHVEAEEYLVETGGAELAQTEVRFPDCFAEYRRKQIECLPRIPFWPLGDVTRDVKFRHLSIRQQHEKGMIRLPNEMYEENIPPA